MYNIYIFNKYWYFIFCIFFFFVSTKLSQNKFFALTLKLCTKKNTLKTKTIYNKKRIISSIKKKNLRNPFLSSLSKINLLYMKILAFLQLFNYLLNLFLFKLLCVYINK